MKILLMPVAAAVLAFAADPGLVRLEREMTRVAQVTDGTVGACALHLETGRRACVNAAGRFPMASTFKIPIAVALLGRVERGEERLDRMIEIRAEDLHIGSGTLTDLFNKPGVVLSVRNLLELMLLISDNSATDILLREVGGGEKVTAVLRGLGIDGINVNRPTNTLIADARANPEGLLEDPRDTSTPQSMADLLGLIHGGKALKPEMTALLLDILRRCRTGDSRLKGILPQGSTVAHKTGTLSGIANDVGIMTLPDGAGHVAIAAFVKGSKKESAVRDRAIAEVARASHDFFVFDRGLNLNYERIADRIVRSLAPKAGERVLLDHDPAHFTAVLAPLRQKIEAAGARVVSGAPTAELLAQTDAAVMLPLKSRKLSPAEQTALAKWLDEGGSHREIHFHWGQGSVLADGLEGEHTPALDAIYENALDVDYQAISKAQDAAVSALRRGLVRVRTAAGTDLTFRVGNRPFNKQDGDGSAERMRTAKVRVDREVELPCGVLRVAPVETSANGRIVIPEARFGEVTARNIRLEIRKGQVVRVDASENLVAVQAALKETGASSFREFGLGFNPKLPGLAYFGYGKGIVRLSLGDNEELGGAVRGAYRRWFFFDDATVTVNGKPMDGI